MFKRNEGILDRVARLVLGVLLLPTGLFLLGGVQGTVLGLVVAGIGTFGLVSAATGICPLYVPFGFSTLGHERKMMDRCMSMMADFRAGGASGPAAMCGPRRRPRTRGTPTEGTTAEGQAAS